MGSPVCRAFMDEHGMTSAHELSEYYITKMADYLQQHHLQFSGWQEVALGHPETTDRHLNNLQQECIVGIRFLNGKRMKYLTR